MSLPLHILVDADACPVKAEIYRVAERHKVPAMLIANSFIRVPDNPLFRAITVDKGFDAADDEIAGLASATSIVITADILLADRCLKAGAQVISPTGKPFTDASIGSAVATRAIMADLRAGVGTEGIGGPAPFSKADRSRFLAALDGAIVRGRQLNKP
ncbi:MAG: YaiI/YqxD family protein [Pseudomonadota bacterium]